MNKELSSTILVVPVPTQMSSSRAAEMSGAGRVQAAASTSRPDLLPSQHPVSKPSDTGKRLQDG